MGAYAGGSNNSGYGGGRGLASGGHSEGFGGGYGAGSGPGGAGNNGSGDGGGHNMASREAAMENAFNQTHATDIRAMDTGETVGNVARFASSLLGPFGIAMSDKVGSWADSLARDAVQSGEAFGAPSNNGQQYGGGSSSGSGYLANGGLNNNPALPSGSSGGSTDNRSPGQIEMDRQDAFLQYAGGLYHPYMERGEQASSDLYDYYSGNQQPMQDKVNQSVMNSPFLAQNIKLGEDAVARNAQATGGFRSGTTNQNLAQNSQQQYQNLYNRQLQENLQGLGMFGDYGSNALNNYSNFGSGMINQIGTTAGAIESQNIAKDANKQNEQNAWIDAIASGIGSYFGS